MPGGILVRHIRLLLFTTQTQQIIPHHASVFVLRFVSVLRSFFSFLLRFVFLPCVRSSSFFCFVSSSFLLPSLRSFRFRFRFVVAVVVVVVWCINFRLLLCRLQCIISYAVSERWIYLYSLTIHSSCDVNDHHVVCIDLRRRTGAGQRLFQIFKFTMILCEEGFM